MADDWDPFADPAADDDPVSAADAKPAKVRVQTSGPAAESFDGFYGSEDLFSGFRNLRTSDAKRFSRDEFAVLIDELLQIDDSDDSALNTGMEKILSAIAGDTSLNDFFLQRTLPLIVDVVGKKEPRRDNLLEMVLAYIFGFLVSKDYVIPNDTVIADPEGEATGTVVWILGWGGSYMHQLDDVEQFYRGLLPGACIVRIVSSAGVNANVKGSAGLRFSILSAINAALKTWESKAHPKLLVHIFSNGGMITWTELLECWQWLSCKEEPDPLVYSAVPALASVLTGIILDSAPNVGVNDGATLEEGITGIIGTVAPFFHKLMCDAHDGSEESRRQAEAQAVAVRRAAMVQENNPIFNVLRTKPERIVVKGGSVEGKNLHRFEPPVPLQFIYSKKDSVIPYQAVQRYIEDVNKRPNRRDVMLPFQLLFEDSMHIFHKVIHKEKYWQRVKVFATNVLKD